jgi:tripartite-type tricarboxylate transporter receptor subunit TctC
MEMKKHISSYLFSLAAAVALPLPTSAPAADWKPAKPVEFYVPSGTGGGTDQFARLVQSIIVKHKLMEQNIIVINKAGGAGAEGFLEVALAKGDPHKLIFGTNNAYLLPLVVKLPYAFAQLTPVAMMAQDEFLLWVPQDAPYATAKEYLDAVKANPANFRMGGSQSKDTDQTLTELINKSSNVRFTYIPFKSGGEAATQLAGRHVSSNVNNPNENVSQWRAGQVRPLCVFSSERMRYRDKVTATMAWGDIPTCKEQGVNVDEFRMPRAVYMPAGARPEQVDYYVNVLRKVAETPEWKAFLQSNALNGRFLNGDEFWKYILKDEAASREIYRDSGWLVK